MSESATPAQVLDTSAGEFPLHEYRLRQGGREWTVLHTGAVLTRAGSPFSKSEAARSLAMQLQEAMRGSACPRGLEQISDLNQEERR